MVKFTVFAQNTSIRPRREKVTFTSLIIEMLHMEGLTGYFNIKILKFFPHVVLVMYKASRFICMPKYPFKYKPVKIS